MKNFSFRDAELKNNSELRAALQRLWGIGNFRAFLVTAKLGFFYPF